MSLIPWNSLFLRIGVPPQSLHAVLVHGKWWFMQSWFGNRFMPGGFEISPGTPDLHPAQELGGTGRQFLWTLVQHLLAVN